MSIKNNHELITLGNRDIPVDKLVVFLDVDGCLTETNQHKLNHAQHAHLLSTLRNTNGNAFLFTDNDGRLISKMAPYMPVISEGGAVVRQDARVNILSPNADIEMISIIAQDIAITRGITFFVGHSNESQKNPQRMVFELKEAGFGINCGFDEGYKNLTAEFAHAVKSDPRFPMANQFSVIASGADNVELRANEFSKGEQFEKIMDKFPGKIPLMFGNSMSDYPVMQQAFEMGGGGIAVTNDIPPCESILLRTPDIKSNWALVADLATAVQRANMHLSRNAPRTRTTLAQPKHRALVAR